MESQKSDSTEGKVLDELQAELEAAVEMGAGDKVSGDKASGPEKESKKEGETAKDSPSAEPKVPDDPLVFAQNLAKENYDKYLRTAAELDTFRRRSQKDRSELLKYGGESMARDLLEVLDNLERAISIASTAAAGSTGGGEDFISGIKMIAEQYKQVFERHGIRGESGVGKPFDPTKQEALASVPTADKPAGEVIEEFRKTYFFRDKLLRTGQVVVTAAKS